MRLHSRCALIVAAAGSAVPMFIVDQAMAQVPATVVATRRSLTVGGQESQVPGIAAVQAQAAANGTSVVWAEPTSGNPGLSSNNSNPVIDSNGNIMFFGYMAQCSYTDPDTLSTVFLTGAVGVSGGSSSNNRAVFSSTAASGYAFNQISVVARDGSASSPMVGATATSPMLGGPTPSNPGNFVLNGTNNTTGLAGGLSMSSNGKALISGLMAPAGGGTNVGAGLFTGGLSGGFSQAVLNTNIASGTGGAAFALTSSVITSSIGVNTAGQVPYVANLTNSAATSPVTDATNNSGLWLVNANGSGGVNAKVARRGDAATGTTGSVAGNYALGTFVQNNMRISSAGVMFPNTLATTNVPTGFIAPASTQLSVLYYSPITAGVPQAPQLVTQSGVAVPASTGLSGYVYANNSQFSVGQQMVNNSGTVVFNAKFNPNTAATNPSTAVPAIVAGTNDEAIMKWSGGTTTALFATGVTPVPSITGGTTFKSLNFSNTQTRLNNQGHYTFVGTMVGDGTGTGPTPGNIWPTVSGTVAGNDVALFLGNGNVGQASVIARGGDVAPGLGGLLFGNSFSGVIMNNSDMVVFSNTLVNSLGQNGPTGYFAYGPNFGLVDLFIAGNTSLLGANYPLGSISYNANSNGDGGVMSLNDNGVFTFFANSSGGGAFTTNNVVMVTTIPAPAAASVGLLGLAATARRRRR